MTSKYFSGAPYGPKNTVVNCVAPHGLMGACKVDQHT